MKRVLRDAECSGDGAVRVYMESTVGSLQPVIFDALLIILSIFFTVCLDVFSYQTVMNGDKML